MVSEAIFPTNRGYICIEKWSQIFVSGIGSAHSESEEMSLFKMKKGLTLSLSWNEEVVEVCDYLPCVQVGLLQNRPGKNKKLLGNGCILYILNVFIKTSWAAQEQACEE